jgi:molecular chaperone GrpE
MEEMHERSEENIEMASSNGRAPASEPHTASDTMETEQAEPTIADLQAEIEQLREEAATNLEGWQRARAEFANYKKRSEMERSQLSFLTNLKIIEKLLPIIDDFDRALSNLPEELKGSGWIEGVALTRRKLLSLLESEGVKPISVNPGDPFDPAIHEAVTHEDSDEIEPHHIIAELQKGYRIDDRVIRPTLVRVAR